MTTPIFDPDRPLPDMPDPWAGTSVPAARSGPPYAMTEMIAAEPALAERMLAALGRQGGGASTLAGAAKVTQQFQPNRVKPAQIDNHFARAAGTWAGRKYQPQMRPARSGPLISAGLKSC